MGFQRGIDPFPAYLRSAGGRLVRFHRMASRVGQFSKTGFGVLTSVRPMAIIRVRPHEIGHAIGLNLDIQ